jgi:hypothetical protein
MVPNTLPVKDLGFTILSDPDLPRAEYVHHNSNLAVVNL